MTEYNISQAEKKYIIDGLKQDIRTDGRKNNQMRYMRSCLLISRNIEMQANILQQSHGSSRVRFSNGGTDVVVSIKAAVQPIDDTFVLKNQIEISAMYMPSTSSKFKARPIEVSGNVIAKRITELVFPVDSDV